MSANTEQRKLAAIMFTDMVGYSALSQRNEALALDLLEEHRRVVRGLLPRHGGREVKTTGDGFLIEFPSALAAVQGAVELQNLFHERNQTHPLERQLRIRIGIHVGDVVQSEGDIYGDGVNVAARTEPLAEPGGICISRAVFEQVRNKIPEPLVSLGALQLKNIAEPVEVFRIDLPGRHGDVSKKSEAGTPRSEGQKSLAVLPFVNMSDDRENEFLADGLTEDLITAFSRVKDLRVPARTSSFAFKGKNEDIRRIGQLLNVETVLEGSVRKFGNKLRVTAQLVKVSDGFHLRSERYDREMKDVFEIQDDITRAIVSALEVQLTERQGTTLVKVPTQNTEAYELYLKGRHYWNKRGVGLKKAQLYFDLALLEDPNFALALAGLADSWNGLGFYAFKPPRETIPLARAAARRALEIDESLAEAHASLAYVSLFFEWDWPTAEKELRRALERDPHYVPARYWYAVYLALRHQEREAFAEIKRAEEIDPLSATVKWHVGLIHHMLGHFDPAIVEFRRAIEMDANAHVAKRWLGWAYYLKGMHADAVAAWQTYGKLTGAREDELASLDEAFKEGGINRYFERLLEQLLARSRQGYESPCSIALVYAQLGCLDLAFEWLGQACEQQNPGLNDITVNPYFDPLRSDPRFRELLRKMGLVE